MFISLWVYITVAIVFCRDTVCTHLMIRLLIKLRSLFYRATVQILIFCLNVQKSWGEEEHSADSSLMGYGPDISSQQLHDV
jgi:hypothetical protein